MLSIRLNSIESTRIVSLVVDSCYRQSICASPKKYSASGLCRVGWKCCRFDSIRSNRRELSPLSQLTLELLKLILCKRHWLQAYKMALQAACMYRVGNTLELCQCMFLKVKNVNKWNPSELATCVKLQLKEWTYSFTVEYRNYIIKLKISSSISCSYTWTHTCRVSQSVFILGLQLN